MCNGINPIRHAAIDTAVLGIEYIINIFFTPLLCTCWLIMYIVHKSIGECDFWVFKNVIYLYIIRKDVSGYVVLVVLDYTYYISIDYKNSNVNESKFS